jgi:hypothetical protein
MSVQIVQRAATGLAARDILNVNQPTQFLRRSQPIGRVGESERYPGDMS